LKVKAVAEGPATVPVTLPPLFKVSTTLSRFPKVYCRAPIVQVTPEGLVPLMMRLARVSPSKDEHGNVVAIAGIVQPSVPIKPATVAGAIRNYDTHE
jgi:hypothetical protein